MWGSTCESPINSRTLITSSFEEEEEDLLSSSFLNLALEKDGEVIRACNRHVINNNIISDEGNNIVVNGTAGGSSSNTSADQIQREVVDTRSIRSSDNWSSNSDADRQQFFALPSTPQDSIWEYHQNPSYAHGQGALLWNQNSAVNVGASTVSGRGNNYMMSGNQYFYPETQNLSASSSATHHQFGATTSYGTGYFDNGEYYGSKNQNNYVGDWCEPRPELAWFGNNIITLAKDKECSRQLQDLLKLNSSYADLILMNVLDSMFELMMDQQGHHVFDKLVEAYTGKMQLQLIVEKIFLQPCSLKEAALNQYGSYSILKLIKQLKKSPSALKMTAALSSGFFELMINKTGRRVITQCFVGLDYKTNEVLYGEAIRNCMSLATHPEGCVSLNDCINCITGDHRQHLLSIISSNSVSLSYDPSGNFVVQHVLGLHNHDLTLDICTRLRGNYIQLSTTQTGSHVVEKCIRLSREGMCYVVEELIKSNRLLELARDQFGNYVIQTALKTTKVVDIDLYKSLARALQPHLSTLQYRKPGKYVVELIRGDL